MSNNQSAHEVVIEYDNEPVPDKALKGPPPYPRPAREKTEMKRRSEKRFHMCHAGMSERLTVQRSNREGTGLFDLIRVFSVMFFLILGVSPASAGIRIFSTESNLQHSNPDITTNTISGFSPAIGEGCKLVVCASWESNSSAGISSVTYAGLNLIKAVSADEIQRSSIWYLDLDSAAPASGDVVVTFQTPTDSRIGALSLQETAPGAPAQTVSLSDSNTASLTTTIPDALVVGVFTENDEPHDISSTFANTLYSGNSGSSKGLAGYQHEFDTGLKSYTWSSHYTNNYSTVVLAAFTHQAVVAKSSKQNYEDPAATKNTIHDFTVPLGVNRKLVVAASWDGSTTISAVRYGTQILTQAVNASTSTSGRKAAIWYLDAPAFGTYDVEVEFSASTRSRVGAVCLENVAPGPPAQTHQVTGTATANLTTTSAQAMVVGVYTETRPSGSPTLISSNFANQLYSGECSGGSRGYAGFQSAPNAGLHSYTFTGQNVSTAATALAAFDYIEPTISLDPAAIDFVINDTPNRQRQKHLLTMTKTPPTQVGPQEYALSAYWLNNPAQMATADAELVKLYTDGWYDAQLAHPDDAFHWNGFVQSRIYFLYSSQSTYFPGGRMSAAAEEAILNMLWGWASTRCEIGMFDPDTTFYSWGSENHHSMAWIGYWSIAQIMAAHPVHSSRNYADGTTPAAMAAAANEYYKAYVRHRARTGTMIEASSPAYNTITMNTWLSLADFATDPELKAAASSLIDIYWANWAIEQINGVKGGSRNRCKPGAEAVRRSASEDVAWNFFGIGNQPYAIAGAVGATTFWRPSRAVVALALDTEGRGEYGYISRRLGHKDPNPPPVPAGPTEFTWNPLNPEGGHLLRYTWSTPDFVMGTAMMDVLPHSNWIGFSSQDRWNGTIFKGPKTSRIFTQVPYNQNERSVYNTEWGVQNKGVSILQRITTDQDANGQMVWFSLDLNRQESGGWIFAEALDAFAAVKIVDGGWVWTPDGDQFQRNDIPDDLGEWAVLNDEFSPIIMEMARKEDYNGSFSQFQADILDNALNLTGNKLDYTSSNYGTKLTLFTDESALPQVDDVTVNLAPSEAYRSPYLNGEVAGGPVIIQYGNDHTLHVAPFARDTNTLHHWNFDTTATAPTISAASTDSVAVVPGKFGQGYRCNDEAGEQLIMTASSWPANQGTFRYQGWFRLGSGDPGGYLFHVYNQVYLSVNASTATFKINKSGVATDNSSTNVVSINADIGTNNEWQYIEAYYDGSTIKLVTEEEKITAPGIGEFVPNPLYATRPVYIGSRINNNNYVGEMDEIRISVVPEPMGMMCANASINFNTYATWIDEFAIDPEDRDFMDDPDGDSLANGLEAWFGTHPRQFNAGLTNLTGDGTTMTFTHPQNAAAPSDLTGYYEWSPNLIDWYAADGVDGAPGGATVIVTSETVGNTAAVIATASGPIAHLFIRAGVRVRIRNDQR